MNVLDGELVTIQSGSGIETVPLARLLTRLLCGPEIDRFVNLAAPQRGYWWRFLVRCAARALRTGKLSVSDFAGSNAKGLEGKLRAWLLEHTEVGDWELYQPDPSRPGFLQSPTPTGAAPAMDDYRRNTCAILTAVIGTKEHERKSETVRSMDPESMLYALVEYQSGVIFGGRGNYESQLTGSRSGAGSGTPFVGVWVDGSMAKTFRHDVGILLERWEVTAQDLKGDVWALWTKRWDGETSLPAARLDPAFIPYARMIRLGAPVGERFDTVWFRGSSSSRIADHTEGGHLGDPFTPLVPGKTAGQRKVRGTLQKGYDYREVVRLLFPEGSDEATVAPSVAAALRSPPGADIRVILEGMAFEQGKTRGFHRRVVRFPQRAVQSGLLAMRVEPIHEAHRDMLERTGRAKTILRSALGILMNGQPRTREDDRKKMSAILDRVEESVDRHYLDFLFAAAAEGTTEPYRRWLFDLVTGDIFQRAVRSLPRNIGRGYEREVSAEAYLRGRLRKELEVARIDSVEEVHA